MSSQTNSPSSAEPLDLSRWRSLPMWLMIGGAAAVGIGFLVDHDAVTQFAFSWLLAFMFFLTIALGGLGFTILHHLFDAGWSVTIRRIMEQMAYTLRWAWLGWIPLFLFRARLYQWVREIQAGHPDLATKAKLPLFTQPGFVITSLICVGIWWWLSTQLRGWSLKQDETGSVECTRMMRRYSAFGVFLFGLSLTMAAILWVKALEHEWYSTMYGVYIFAGSMWTAVATIYVITLVLDRQGPLKGLVHHKTYYFIGSILFAFTVFYAYVTFAQYFITWNANIPEEGFWYVQRTTGTWWWVCMIIIFGHFFVPFLGLLRIDVKLKYWFMVPLVMWIWLMQFVDMSFNIVPVLHKGGYHLDVMDLGCMALIGGFVARSFLKQLFAHPIAPQRDPRFAESQEIYVPADEYVEAATARGINHKGGGGH
ncbi:MAG TPA: hypothetical protein VG754_07930 [Verrucomicrobiae bacterium]|nr:hypothetical protein [Verrucomicrobiae bacterium]